MTPIELIYCVPGFSHSHLSKGDKGVDWNGKEIFTFVETTRFPLNIEVETEDKIITVTSEMMFIAEFGRAVDLA